MVIAIMNPSQLTKMAEAEALNVSGELADHREASYQAQSVKQLTIAHSSSILVYSKSGSDTFVSYINIVQNF